MIQQKNIPEEDQSIQEIIINKSSIHYKVQHNYHFSKFDSPLHILQVKDIILPHILVKTLAYITDVFPQSHFQKMLNQDNVFDEHDLFYKLKNFSLEKSGNNYKPCFAWVQCINKGAHIFVKLSEKPQEGLHSIIGKTYKYKNNMLVIEGRAIKLQGNGYRWNLHLSLLDKIYNNQSFQQTDTQSKNKN